MLVFQALCTSGKNMGQRVALKYAHTAYEAASLTREQKFCEKVGQHPNCQPLLDVIEKQGFGVMSVVPLYNRGSLLEKAEMIRRHPKEEYMPFYIVSSLVRDFQQAAAGLVHLHAHSIVHGDIKEGNILLRFFVLSNWCRPCEHTCQGAAAPIDERPLRCCKPTRARHVTSCCYKCSMMTRCNALAYTVKLRCSALQVCDVSLLPRN